jgi:hypothetical protein
MQAQTSLRTHGDKHACMHMDIRGHILQAYKVKMVNTSQPI